MYNLRRKGMLLLAAVILSSMSMFAQKSGKLSLPEIDIPYQKFVLNNGLTLLVHEDHKAPIVAFNVWYHVGSKNEKPGKTGFAHLFEHLMFNGSENYDSDYFLPLEKVGATDLNGTTSNDRTNYFENVPVSALDVALFMESDRMGHLIGAITQAKLDEQRGVVQNEKRQYENEPYGRVDELMTTATYPKGHPYATTVIGSMEDLNAASLEDVHEWFKTYYGAANAVICIAGDIDAKTAKEKIEKYFGDIPSGPPIAKFSTWIAKRTGESRQQLQDRVPQARIYKVWNIPEWASKEATYLDLLSDILASGKTSRLYKRLVYDDQIATSVSAYADIREIAGQFVIEATAKPGEDLRKVEKALDEELAKLLQEGPKANELKKVQTQYFANFVRGIERIGGFGGKSDILAMNQVYGGSPDYYKTKLNWVKNASTADIHKAAKDWLSDGVYVLEVYPFPEYNVAASTLDRKVFPEPGSQADAKFPRIEKAELSNGMKIVLAERHTIPVVSMSLLIDAGYAADQFTLPGTAGLAVSMMDEGTKKRNALQISEELAMLGARLGTYSSLDMSYVSLSALKSNLEPTLELFSDVVLNPSFPQEDYMRLQKQKLAQIQNEKITPIQMALRVFPQFLYGKDHAYGNPLTGSGTEESVKRITRDDLIKFHQTWFKPNNATLVVVGDVTMAEIKPKLENLFNGWTKGNVPTKNIGNVEQQKESVVYMIDRPGSLQSIIFAGHVAPSSADPADVEISSMNNILGGSFTSRINMNIREDKHWSYGASSFLWGARGQRPFLVYTSVQTDKTMESMTEIGKEVKDIVSGRPATDEELSKIQKSQILELAGSWESSDAIANSIINMVQYGLSDDYYEKYPGKVRGLTVSSITETAKTVLHPDKLVWVIVGDRSKIEAPIRQANFGKIVFIDSDGKALPQSSMKE